MAIPRGLVSQDMIKQMEGIRSVRTNVLPANSSGNYAFQASGNNRVIFQIPAFANSFINQKRSYIKFTLAGSGKMISGCPVFRRMLLKNARGQVLEDVNEYDYLCKIMDSFKTSSELRGQAYTHKKLTGLSKEVYDKASMKTAAGGKTIIHELNSGLLGNTQEFMIPVSTMNASSGYAFQLELFLNSDDKVVDSGSYTIQDVSYEIELLEVTDQLMMDLNNELSQGQELPLPYRSYRAHTTSLTSSSSQKVNISESAVNLEGVMSVIKPVSHSQTTFTDANVARAVDPYNTIGGKINLKNDGTDVEESDKSVIKYSFRYGSQYFPTSPVELVSDSVLALENALCVMDLKNDLPVLTENIVTSAADQLVPRFEATDFIIAHSFRTSADNVKNGLNASSSGAPLELNLSFKGNMMNHEVLTFVQQQNTLYIQKDGGSSIITS